MIDIIAIDPGSVGGIVNLCVTNNGIVTVEAEALAKLTRRELIDWSFDRATPVTRGLIEKVAPQPAFDPKTKQRRSMGAKSAFTFGANFERVQMALVAADVPCRLVPAKEWQKGVGLFYPKGTNHTEHKQAARQHAQAFFPNVDFKITNAIADALLIAEYGRRLEETNGRS